MREREFILTLSFKDTFGVVCVASGLPPQAVEHRILRIKPRSSALATNVLGVICPLMNGHKTVVFR